MSVAAPEETSTPPSSVLRVLQCLDAFRQAGPQLGVSDIAAITGIPKSTTFRLLAHLVQLGYVTRAGRDYVLGRRFFEIGNAVDMCRPEGLREIAKPHLTDLYASVGKTVHLAVLDGADVVYLDKIYGASAVRIDTTIGSRMPASCTGLGKALLAFSGREAIGSVLRAGLTIRTRYSMADPRQFLSELRRVHDEGVAYDREESTLGIACVAAPILSGGRCLGAISVSARAVPFDARTLAPQVAHAAGAIGALAS